MIILASSSPRRTELLTAAGIRHRIITEDTFETVSGTPAAIVRENARRKAGAVAEAIAWGKYNGTDDLKGLPVLGADTIVALEQNGERRAVRIFGKPKDETEAREMLRALSGRVHSVYTGICFLKGGQEFIAVEKTSVHFLAVSREALERYIASGEWSGKAGAYAVQGRAMAFVDRLEGSAANVIGLPVHAVVALAEKNGIDLYGD